MDRATGRGIHFEGARLLHDGATIFEDTDRDDSGNRQRVSIKAHRENLRPSELLLSCLPYQ